MRFGFRYRGLPKFLLRRVNRMAGEVLGVAMLDFLCLAQKFVDAPAPAVQTTAQMP